MKRAVLLLGAALMAGGAAFGCNQVLGYDKATEDPTLEDSGTASPCDSYCAAVIANCPGDHSQYISNDVCLAMCAQMDSVNCRAQHAAAAATNPAGECSNAGPYGGTACTNDLCGTFCQLAVAECNAVPVPGPPPTPYPNLAQCKTDCATYTMVDAGDNLLSQTGGNTLNCREYHLEAAYQGGSNTGVHCPHTVKVNPNSPCQ
jgi:hypothetical protein